MKKEELKAPAEGIVSTLRENSINTYYSAVGSIGKRYARLDEIGVPYAVTVDYQTLEDGTVTIRFRNDGKQKRVKISELAEKLKKYKKEGRFTL
jgi:glycyl-tRNA synthetase